MTFKYISVKKKKGITLNDSHPIIQWMEERKNET